MIQIQHLMMSSANARALYTSQPPAEAQSAAAQQPAAAAAVHGSDADYLTLSVACSAAPTNHPAAAAPGDHNTTLVPRQ